MSKARNYYESRYENGEIGSWLLADSGYALEAFVMTPYRSPNTINQQTFNRKHSSARNVVERTIGILKSRFRCLSRTLWYSPSKVVQIINICCALHNLCIFLKLENVAEIVQEIDDDDTAAHEENNEQGDEAIQGNIVVVRNNIANSLFL